MQNIYNSNYNFSRPPYKPTLTAVPGDGKVFLYWDKIAEESRDPFLGFQDGDPTKGYKKDFEGYLVYRSTEAEFNDIKLITDSKGDPKYYKPIAQYDLNDSIKGPDPVGINGARFWRGSNTGLQHSFIDTDVNNGQRYYYALVSYDMGDPDFGTSGLQPSECTKIISEDFAGTVNFIDINCAVVTPNAPVAGYVPAEILGDTKKVDSGIGTGNLTVNILNPAQIKDGANYEIKFKASTDFPLYRTQSYSIIRNFGGVVDTLERNIDSSNIGENKFSPPFDGMAVSVKNDTLVAVIDSLTGWLVGNSNFLIDVVRNQTSKSLPWPSNYEINFSDPSTIVDSSFFTRIPVNFKICLLYTSPSPRDRTRSRMPSSA